MSSESALFIINIYNIFALFIRITVMGNSEKLGVNIHVDQLMESIAINCGNIERLELR